MADQSETIPVPAPDDPGEQPKPAADRGLSPNDTAEGADLTPQERGGTSAD